MQRSLSVGFEDSYRRHLIPEQRKAVLEVISHDMNPGTTLGDIVDAAQELGWGDAMGELSLGDLAVALLGGSPAPQPAQSAPETATAPEPVPPQVEALAPVDTKVEAPEDEDEDVEEEEETEAEEVVVAAPEPPPAPARTKTKAKAKAKAKAAKAKPAAKAKKAVAKAKPAASKAKKTTRKAKPEDDDLESFFPVLPLFGDDELAPGKKAKKRAKKAAMYVPTSAGETEAMNLEQAAKLLLPIVKKLREATMQDLEEQTSMGRRKLRFHIGQLVKHGRLKRHGMGRGTCYTVVK